MITYDTYLSSLNHGNFNGRLCHEMTYKNGIGGLYFANEESKGVLTFSKERRIVALTNKAHSSDIIRKIIENPRELASYEEIADDIIKTISEYPEVLDTLPIIIAESIPNFAKRLKTQFNLTQIEKTESMSLDEAEKYLEQTSGHAAKIIAFTEKFEKIQKMRQGSQIDVDNQQEL